MRNGFAPRFFSTLVVFFVCILFPEFGSAQTWWSSLLPSSNKQLRILTPAEQATLRIQNRRKQLLKERSQKRQQERKQQALLQQDREQQSRNLQAWQSELLSLRIMAPNNPRFQTLQHSFKTQYSSFAKSSYQLSVLYDTKAQLRLTLQHVLSLYLQERQQRAKTLQENYPSSRYPALQQLQKTYIRREQQYKERLATLQRQLSQILTQNLQNQKALTRSRRSLFASIPSLPLPSPTPSSRPSSRPVSSYNGSQLQEGWAELVRAQRRLGFKLLFLKARLLLERQSINALEQELFGWKLQKVRFVLQQITRHDRVLRSKHKGGLLHRVPALWYNRNVWKPTWARTKALRRDAAFLLTLFPRDVGKELRRFKKQRGYSLFWWELLLLLCVVPCYLLFRKVSLLWTQKFEARARAGKDTRQLWLTIRLLFFELYSLSPLLLYLSPVLLFLVAIDLPRDIELVFWSITAILLGIQASWVLANQLFSPDPELRLIHHLDNRSTTQFRIILKFFTLIAFVYRPLFWTFQALEYPQSFLSLWELLFYGCLLLCTLILFLNKDAILSLVPTNSVLGRFLVLLLANIYPLVLLLMIILFGIFVWGYHNLAGYVFFGSIATLVLGGLTYLFSELAWLFSLWFFGMAEDEDGIFPVEPEWGQRLIRSLRFVTVTALSVMAIFLSLKAWGLTQGLQTLWNLLKFPFLRIENAQVSVLAILQLGLIGVLTIWFSRLARRKAQRYVYPLFHMTEGRIYAYNTILAYLLYTIGLMTALQWMGVGLSGLFFLAGVLGIGVGFGVKNIVNSFVASIVVTFGKTIGMGDLVEINGIVGRVVRLSGRSITLETYEHRLVVIPNDKIMTEQVTNWTKGAPFVRLRFQVGVAHGTDTELVRRTMFQVAYDHPSVLKNPAPFVLLEDLDSNALVFSLWISVMDAFERFRVLSELRLALEQKFRELDITIAFPQQDVHLAPALEEALVENLRSSTDALQHPEPPTPLRLSSSLAGEFKREVPTHLPPEPAAPAKREETGVNLEDGARTGKNIPKGTEIRRASTPPKEAEVDEEEVGE